MNKKNASNLLLLFTAAIWGFAFVAQKSGGNAVPPLYFNGLRFLLGAVSLVPVVLIFAREKTDRGEWARLLRASALCGAVLFIASALQQRGIVMTSAGKGAFITALYAVLVPIFYFLLFRRKTGLHIWIGAVLAIVGIFLLSVHDFTIGAGDVVLLIGAVFWAAHIMFIDAFVRNVNPLKFAMLQAFFCGIYNLIFASFTEKLTLASLYDARIELLYCGICSAGIAYTCQIIGQKHADPTVAPIIMSSESLFGVLGGMLLGNETMPLQGYIGCVLIFAGMILSQLSFPLRKGEKASCGDEKDASGSDKDKEQGKRA